MGLWWGSNPRPPHYESDVQPTAPLSTWQHILHQTFLGQLVLALLGQLLLALLGQLVLALILQIYKQIRYVTFLGPIERLLLYVLHCTFTEHIQSRCISCSSINERHFSVSDSAQPYPTGQTYQPLQNPAYPPPPSTYGLSNWPKLEVFESWCWHFPPVVHFSYRMFAHHV